MHDHEQFPPTVVFIEFYIFRGTHRIQDCADLSQKGTLTKHGTIEQLSFSLERMCEFILCE